MPVSPPDAAGRIDTEDRRGEATPGATPGSRAGRGLRRYRLSGIGAFEALFRTGRRREGAWLQIVVAPAAAPPGRVGFVIGRKALRRAVDRNRVRRVLREVLRRARPGIEAYDMILRLKRGCERQEVAAVAAEASALLARLVAEDAGAVA